MRQLGIIVLVLIVLGAVAAWLLFAPGEPQSSNGSPAIAPVSPLASQPASSSSSALSAASSSSASASANPRDANLVDMAPTSADTEPPCALSGRVVHEGRGIANIAVTLRRQEEWDTVATASVTTSQDGSFTFGQVRPSWYRVSVEDDGYLPATAAWRCEKGEGKAHELVLVRGDARIHGRVVDEDGGPIADAEVTVQELGPKEERAHFRVATYVHVDNDGRYAFAVAQSDKPYRVYASAPGYGFENEDRVVTDELRDAEVNFALPREGWVEGVVTKSDSTPAAGADVFQRGKGMLVGTKANADGTFAMAMRPGNPMEVVARLGSEVGRVQLTPLTKGESRLGVAVRLVPGRTVTGSVEPLDGSAVAGVQVLVSELPVGASVGGVVVTTTTDERGRFSVDGMPTTQLRARVRNGPGIVTLDP